jgi:hypothetical protein
MFSLYLLFGKNNIALYFLLFFVIVLFLKKYIKKFLKLKIFFIIFLPFLVIIEFFI